MSTGTWPLPFSARKSAVSRLSWETFCETAAIWSCACFMAGTLATKLAARFIAAPPIFHSTVACPTPGRRRCHHQEYSYSAATPWWTRHSVQLAVTDVFIETQPSPSKNPTKYSNSSCVGGSLGGSAARKGSWKVWPSTSKRSSLGNLMRLIKAVKRSRRRCHLSIKVLKWSKELALPSMFPASKWLTTWGRNMAREPRERQRKGFLVQQTASHKM